MKFEKIRCCFSAEGLRMDSFELGEDAAGSFLLIKAYPSLSDMHELFEIRNKNKTITVTVERNFSNLELIEHELKGIVSHHEFEAAMKVVRKYVSEVK